MTFSNDTLDEQQYDAWQHQLLAEMGITRWVSQNCPVTTYDDIEDLDVFANQQAIKSASTRPLIFDPQQTDFTSQAEVVDTTFVLANPVSPDDAVSTATVIAPTRTPIAELDVTPSEDYDKQVEALPTASFDLQAIVVGEWTLVVDSSYLQKDDRQRQLWQQITHAFRAERHFFRFPLLADSHQLPTATAQLMRSYPMAVAGFLGFLFSINQGNAKVGALTQLPDCLDKQPIQRLPYLFEMLDDYRLKRQLWLLLSS